MNDSDTLAQRTSARPPDALPTFKNDDARDRYLAAYDAAVREWPIACEQRDIPSRWGSTHVIVSGPADAPPLLLLPSFAGTATAWRLNVAGLSAHYRTYAIDVIAQPGKGWSHRGLRDRREYADWLGEVLDGLGLSRVSIVGCSFGGFLALNQASLTPQRVERVVMISPVGSFASQLWKLTYSARIKRPLVKLWRRLSGSKRAPSMTDLGVRPPRDTLWAALMATTMMPAFSAVGVINPAVLSRRELRAIRAPALLLIGDAERLYEPAAMARLARTRMPALETAIVADADHIAAMAQPDEVNARILRFLQPRD